MNKHNQKETVIYKENMWLPEGRGWGRGEIGEGN